MPTTPSESDRSAPWASEADQLRTILASRPAVSAFCHENPDGDTIGAAVALALAAREFGCDVELVAEAIPSEYLSLLDGLEVNARPALPPEVAVVCDAASLERVGAVARERPEWFDAATIVVVDHHVTNRGFGALNFVDPSAAASCEVVAEVLEAIGVPIDAQMAEAILTGIIRDSNGFTAESTRARTLRAAASAMDAGGELATVYRRAILDMPQARMRLWGRLLARMETTAGGQIVHTVLSDEDLAATESEQSDAEGLAEFLMRGAGVRVAILFRTLPDSVRVSVRTVAPVDAAAIVAPFGGGGHHRRAGCIVPSPSPATLDDVLTAACRALS